MKRIFLVPFLICVVSGILSADSLILPDSFSLVDSSGPYVQVLTPYATYPILLTDFEPRQLFEGKWGTGPGEFGYELFASGDMERYDVYPKIAVNSRGEIYILDHMNNRIQIFSQTGKLLNTISVLSRADKNGKSIVCVSDDRYGNKVFDIGDNREKSYFYGIDLAVDAKDNLYYCLRKGKNGEVIKFFNDKLVKKYEIVADVYALQGPAYDGRVYAMVKNTEKLYDFELGGFVDYPWPDKVEKIGYTVELDRKKRLMNIITQDDHVMLAVVPDTPDKYQRETLTPYDCFLMPNGTVRVFTSYWTPLRTNVFDFDAKGNILGLLPDQLNSEVTASSARAKIAKFAEEYGGGSQVLGNDGEQYISISYKNGYRILRDEIVNHKR